MSDASGPKIKQIGEIFSNSSLNDSFFQIDEEEEAHI